MFLNSSLNVELVYIILKGITAFNNEKKIRNKDKIEISEIGPDTMITLKQVKIKDL